MNDYFDKLIQDRTQSADVLEKPSMQGVKLSVVEKYSERAHFIFELIQNADDVQATYIKFILNQEGLYFIHNGKIKFSVSNPDTETEDKHNNKLGHINAITSIGQSSKTENEIGKFGVGFKAVFQYCETPEIYEDDYKFKIERFIIPNKLMTERVKREKHETVFYFPFNNSNTSKEIAFSDISLKLKTLQNPLLFVNFIKKISWDIKKENITESGVYSKEVIKEEQFNDINFKQIIQHLKKSNELHPSSFSSIIFSRELQIENRKLNYSVVFFLEKENRIDYSKEYPLYCYFPTQKVTKLKFITQAPFLLVDNRQDIKHNDWNEKLINYLAQLTADCLPIFKQKGFINDDFFNVLPIKEDSYKNTIFSPFYDLVLKKLKSGEELLPTKENVFTKYGFGYLAESDRILSLFTSEQLADLLQEPNAKWIFPTMYGTRKRKNDLNDFVYFNLANKELSPRDLIEKIREQFIQKQTDEWLIKFYEVVSNIKDVWELLRNRPVIRTEKNENIIPYNLNKELQVFFPTNIESEYPTVKRFFVQNEKIFDFLKNLGIREPDLKAEIENKILPRYKINKSFDINTLLNDFEIFFKYYSNCPQYELDLFISKISDLPFIIVTNQYPNKSINCKANLVYFKTKDLELYFENYKRFYYDYTTKLSSYHQDINWLDTKSYQKIIDIYGKDKFILFLKKLGVETKPRKTQIDITNDYSKYGITLTNRYTRRFHVIDYNLEGLDDFLKDMTFDKSNVLWKILTELIEFEYYFFKGEHKYFYYSTNYESFDSKILRNLINNRWLYSDNDNLNPKKPSEIYFEELSKKYNIKSENAQKLISKLVFRKPPEPEKEEWEKFWDTKYKKQLLEHYQKTKDVTDEDIEELNRIKKKRLLLNKSGSPKPTKKGKAIEEIDESELLDLYALRDLTLNIEHVLKFPFSSIKRTIDDLVENINDIQLEEIKFGLSTIMFSVNQWEKGLDFVISFAPNVNRLYSEIEICEIIKYIFTSKNKLQLEEENIHFELNLPDKCYLNYNRNYFEDIINNLLDNSIKALKFKEEKKIVKCSINITDENLTILFSDNGIGIKDNEKEEIFTMYKTKTKELGGLGIGLYIVRTRLSSINGSIEVIENEFKPAGATFKILIPLKNE